MGSIPIVSNGVKMASSLRGLVSKKKQPVENQEVQKKDETPPVEVMASQEAVVETFPVVSESESIDSAIPDASDVLNALETAVDMSTETTEVLSIEASSEAVDTISTKKPKKQNSKKKGTENQ